MENVKTAGSTPEVAEEVEQKEKIGFFSLEVRPRIWEFFWCVLGINMAANVYLAYLSGNTDEAWAWGICTMWIFIHAISVEASDSIIKSYRWMLHGQQDLMDNMLGTLRRQDAVMREQNVTLEGAQNALVAMEKERDMYKAQYEATAVVKEAKSELKSRSKKK